MFDSIAILDFGSQFTQLIARRLRHFHAYCEIFPWNAPPAAVQSIAPRGYILSADLRPYMIQALHPAAVCNRKP